MEIVKFEIKDHSDRMAMLEALQANGYEVSIKTDTSYMPPKTFVYVRITDKEKV